jgi:hypothetical protein
MTLAKLSSTGSTAEPALFVHNGCAHDDNLTPIFPDRYNLLAYRQIRAGREDAHCSR